MNLEFKDKFIAYIDVLGFKRLVEAAERGEGMTLGQILEVLGKLGRTGQRARFERSGPFLCPAAPRLEKHLDFRSTQISDCVILPAEVSPAGVINLIEEAWMAVTELLAEGLLCRGYITRGSIFHTDAQVIGTGYQRAYESEKSVIAFQRDADDRGTPFVEVDASVREYVATCDRTVKEMFSRLVKDDGTVTALYPFQQFAAKFAITKDFDPKRQKESNANLRRWLQLKRAQIAAYLPSANPNAAKKIEHYLSAIDRQLDISVETDHLIDRLGAPFPRS